jgi:hypothetical protein
MVRKGYSSCRTEVVKQLHREYAPRGDRAVKVEVARALPYSTAHQTLVNEPMTGQEQLSAAYLAAVRPKLGNEQ